MDPDETLRYRQALGAFATGVVIVTAQDAGQGAVGLVANSFTSVALDPPLILWCLGDASDRGVYFRSAERFGVSVLAAEQEALSARIARRGQHRLEPSEVTRDPAGLPLIAGALSGLSCRTRERLHVGDHLVIVGEVERFSTGPGDGLTYFRGRYGRAATPQV